LARLPDIEASGPPQWARANGIPLVDRIARLPMRFTPC
jgi:hypothetical protein